MSDELRGLSLLQPRASLIAAGAKTIETRSWRTRYRGRVAIHASGDLQPTQRALVLQRPFRDALGVDLWATGERWPLPLYAIVALATIAGCVPTSRYAAGYRPEAMPVEGSWEATFGDYTPGRYAWLLTDIRPLPAPISCKGALGLWRVPAPVREQIEAALSEEPRP